MQAYERIARPQATPKIRQSLNLAAHSELGQLVKKNLKQVNTGSIPYNVTLGTAQSVASGQTVVKRAQNGIDITPEFLAASGSDFTAEIRTNYLQAVDYRYNIRGQLVNINNSKLIDDNGVTNNDVNDLFGADILYNVVDANVGNTAQWSGRISAVKWMSRNADYSKTNERSYKYSYDVLNRLNSGVYAERGSTSTGSFNLNSNGFNESGITYDDNGNILSLQRNSSSVGASSNIQVDDLVYTYDTDNPNRLKKVVDGVGANYVSYGFRNLTGSSADYGYDSSGNLVTDPYKGLSVSYNELNRADQITVTTATNRYIRYTYDSGGQLLRKQAYDNAVLQKTTDYIDGFVYENSSLAYFAIPEGRVVNVSGTLTPEFVIADQQGNARISFRDDGSGRAVVVQENSYYAFGLTFATSPVGTPAVPNKNLYNGGSEWQNDFSNLPDYYQTFFRNYEQALGRFVSLDPMAEAAESLTGYNYSGNNPVMFNDPLGDVYADSDEPAYKPPVVDANGIPAGDPGYGGGSGGGGSLWTFGSGGGWSGAFQMMGVYDRQRAHQLGDRETSYGVLQAARGGDLAAIAQYAAQMGATTITDPGEIKNIIAAVYSGNYSMDGNIFTYGGPLNRSILPEIDQSDRIYGILLPQAEIRNKPIGHGPLGLSNLPALRDNKGTWSRTELNDGAIEQGYWVFGEIAGPLIGTIKWAPKAFKLGKTFAQYKAARGGTATLRFIETSTGIQRISTEFHHVFITQRMQKLYNLPNWLVNNQLNIWKLNTIQHSLIDSYRFNFLRAGIKPEVGWFGKYNWFTKF